ncbi:MAG: hypothetical protein HF312_15515 [Ignavibacteria bacterium]|jgi:hypothetical protein|nr:hypothetical protein [Ignavibacteria bacterium]
MLKPTVAERTNAESKLPFFTKSFSVPVYGYDCTLVIGSVEEMNGWMQRKFKIPFNYEDGWTGCYLEFAARDKWNRVIWLDGFKGQNTICDLVHECVHAANGIYAAINANPDTENDEPFAYLVGHIFEQCINILSQRSAADAKAKTAAA